jgi:hypothetical protein
MALEREQNELFNRQLNTAKKSVMKTLHNKHLFYKYIDTKEVNENLITTTIKPLFWPLLLKTKIEIQILQENNSVNVIAKTIAQPQIKGDVFKMYNGCLNSFFKSLRSNS